MIDSLIVTLNLDASKFSAETSRTQQDLTRVGQAATQQGRRLEDDARKQHEAGNRRLKASGESAGLTSQQFSKLRNEIIGVYAALTTGSAIQSFVLGMTKTEAQVGRTAKTIGMSVSDLNAWQEAAKRTGGSAEGISSSFMNLSQEFEKIQLTGHSDLQQYFVSLGVSISDATGKLRPMNDIMMDLADKFSRMRPSEANYFGRMLGLDEGTIQLLMQGRQAVSAYLEDAHKIGVMNEQQARNAQEFQAQLARLEQSFANLGRVILDAALPSITHFVDVMTNWISKPENQKFISDEVVTGVKNFAEQITHLVETFNEWKGVAEALAIFIGGRWLIGMMAGFGPLGIAVAALAAGWLALQKAMHPQDPKEYAAESPLWQGIPEEEQLRYEQSPASRAKRGETGRNPNPFNWLNPGSYLDRPAGGLADTSMNDAQRGFLNTIAGPESQGRYNVLNGGEEFTDFSRHPNRVGKGGKSTAAGRYQFTRDTWNEYSRRLGLTDFSPQSQDRAAWALASDRYKANTGRNLEADVRDGGHAPIIASALRATWTSLPGGSESQESVQAFDEALRRNQMNRPTLRPEATPSVSGAAESIRNGASAVGDWLREQGRWLVSPTGGRPAAPATSNTSSNETNINGPINIHTQARDANGIAQEISEALRRHSYVSQANTGLQ